MPRAEAVGRKLLAREMNQPDVSRELPIPAQLEKDRRPQHHGGCRGVIVVGASGRQAGTITATISLVAILHISGVVMIGHNHRLAAVTAGNDDDQISLGGLAGLIVKPATHPVKIEVSPPAER